MTSTLIKCGKLYDGLKDELQPDMQILVEGAHIKAVGKNLDHPADVNIVDLSDATVTPGMIDAHVHPEKMTKKPSAVTESDVYRGLATLKRAQTALEQGFTTMRCMGEFYSRSYVTIDVKRAIDQGHFRAARLIVAHGCATSGSHGDFSQSQASHPELCIVLEKFRSIVGDGPEFFRNAIRRERKLGYDFVKIMATGGFMTETDSPEDQQLSDDELEMIINTAHEVGLSVTAHAYGSELVKKLIQKGIDGIEHAAMVDEETMQMIVDNNIYVVPTFSPYDEIVTGRNEKELLKKTPHLQAKLRHYAEELKKGRKVIVKCMNDKYAHIGYGTDYTYECGEEYSAMLRSGVDPFRILQSATKINAEILGIDDMVGTIQPGKRADISAWRKDLLTDHEALLDCAYVMKDGLPYPTKKAVTGGEDCSTPA